MQHRSDLAYTYVYAARREVWMPRTTAKLFMNNRSQAVRLPKEFQFNAQEVFIRREGDEVILSARPKDWSAYLASGPVASEDFMQDVEDLPMQERNL
jgi:antitoxin VapB